MVSSTHNYLQWASCSIFFPVLPFSLLCHFPTKFCPVNKDITGTFLPVQASTSSNAISSGIKTCGHRVIWIDNEMQDTLTHAWSTSSAGPWVGKVWVATAQCKLSILCFAHTQCMPNWQCKLAVHSLCLPSLNFTISALHLCHVDNLGHHIWMRLQDQRCQALCNDVFLILVILFEIVHLSCSFQVK